MKAYLSAEQAISILPEGDEVHTFRNAGTLLMGCDMLKASLEDKIRKSDYLELTGATAKGMGHGLVVYDENARQEDFLFVETDSESLEKLERALKGEVQWSKQGKCPATPEQFEAIYNDDTREKGGAE